MTTTKITWKRTSPGHYVSTDGVWAIDRKKYDLPCCITVWNVSKHGKIINDLPTLFWAKAQAQNEADNA